MKYQQEMLPNGMIPHCYGPFEGRRYDAAMYNQSGLDAQLQAIKVNSVQMALYGNGGYGNRDWLMTPFRNATDVEAQAFNAMMSHARVSIEWGFGKVNTLFAFINFYANQKFYLQLLGAYFTVATLLANCHTCLYGSKVASYFALDPPPLDVYLA